jgi:Raf kinase inhibitor-like YbhB/YbcL family protein
MQLTSSAFSPGGAIPARFTCDGANVSPPLAWFHVPQGARSFALVCADPDAPGGTWYHWAIYDIPGAARGLREGVAPTAAQPPQATNDFRQPGYGGPCPPRGHGPHRYVFTLYAIGAERLAVAPRAGCRAVEAAGRAAATASAELIGRYGRS